MVTTDGSHTEQWQQNTGKHGSLCGLLTSAVRLQLFSLSSSSLFIHSCITQINSKFWHVLLWWMECWWSCAYVCRADKGSEARDELGEFPVSLPLLLTSLLLSPLFCVPSTLPHPLRVCSDGRCPLPTCWPGAVSPSRSPWLWPLTALWRRRQWKSLSSSRLIWETAAPRLTPPRWL